jgi:hypothetical protein
MKRTRSKTLKKIKKLIKEFRLIHEDGFAGSGVGGGAIAGAGIGPQGEPGVHPEDQPGFKKRKSDFPKPKSPVMTGMFKRKSPKI